MKVIDRPSPNHDARPDGQPVDILLLHYTDMAPLLGIEPIPDDAPEAQSARLVPVSATTE